jgi:hypothetical protein
VARVAVAPLYRGPFATDASRGATRLEVGPSGGSARAAAGDAPKRETRGLRSLAASRRRCEAQARSSAKQPRPITGVDHGVLERIAGAGATPRVQSLEPRADGTSAILGPEMRQLQPLKLALSNRAGSAGTWLATIPPAEAGETRGRDLRGCPKELPAAAGRHHPDVHSLTALDAWHGARHE